MSGRGIGQSATMLLRMAKWPHRRPSCNIKVLVDFTSHLLAAGHGIGMLLMGKHR